MNIESICHAYFEGFYDARYGRGLYGYDGAYERMLNMLYQYLSMELKMKDITILDLYRHHETYINKRTHSSIG